MILSSNISQKNSIEKNVAKAYIFLLPFRMIMPFEFLINIIGPLANYFDTILLIWGLCIWIGQANSLFIPKANGSLYRTTQNSILYLNLSSLIMAIVMYLIYGDYNGASPFIAIIPMELFYFQYLLMFIYSIRIFSILDYSTILKQISRTCTVLLVLGYIQVLVMLNIGVGIYDVFANLIGGLLLADKMTKLSLTCSEGAAAGVLLGVFVFPFLFARYLHGDKKAIKQLLLWLIPLYFTDSSVAYILFALDTFIFVYLFAKRTRVNRFIIMLIGIVFISGCVITIISIIGLLNADAFDKITYLLFEKATDDTNGSTAARTVPLIVNWGCFKEMPVMGVGNGLQGYFYLKYFPTHLLSVPGTDLGVFYDKIREGGIANGGTFLPGYLSGYGIIGIIVLINFVIKLRKTQKQRTKRLGIFNEMFTIGSIAFLIAGLTSEMYCTYFAWFVISIPFMNYADTSTNKYNS